MTTSAMRLPSLDFLLEQQGGAVTSQQLYAAGATVKEVQQARRRGDLVDLRRGIYADATVYRRLDDEQRYRLGTHAALLALDAPAALSHTTAALWCDLPLLEPLLGIQHVTRPEARASRIEAGIHHHPGALPSDDVVAARGARATRPARTAVDIARTQDFARGLAAADSALRSGATRLELERVMAFCRAWPGARGASRVVSAADGRAANPGESWSRARLLMAGLDPTDLQVEIRDGRGLVGYADFGWLPLRVLGEFDGKGKYGAEAGAAADAVWQEKIREDRLRAVGFHIVRWTWTDLLQPEPWLGRVRVALAAAQARDSRGA